VTRCRVLSEHALGEFYQRHARSVWNYVYRVTNNAADADDIVQEAFLRLFQVDVVPANDDGLRKYVFRIAGNLIADRWRKRKRDERRDGEAVPTASGEQCDLDVARTFAELRPRDRALLWLAYVEGETHEDIAASLRVGRSSVKVLLSRARARLRDLLTARRMFHRLEK
jgi:RNA polymerase sigma-70 factor (ECF subfamily)